jgi:hypothetical protein
MTKESRLERSTNALECPDASELPWPDDASQELLKAVEGKEEQRAAALTFWREIACGRIGPEEIFWMRYVACQVVIADREKAQRRPGALTKALGLHGPADPWRELRVTAAALRDFGAKRDEILTYLHRAGLLDSETVDARSLLNRELKKDRERGTS